MSSQEQESPFMEMKRTADNFEDHLTEFGKKVVEVTVNKLAITYSFSAEEFLAFDWVQKIMTNRIKLINEMLLSFETPTNEEIFTSMFRNISEFTIEICSAIYNLPYGWILSEIKLHEMEVVFENNEALILDPSLNEEKTENPHLINEQDIKLEALPEK